MADMKPLSECADVWAQRPGISSVKQGSRNHTNVMSQHSGGARKIHPMRVEEREQEFRP